MRNLLTISLLFCALLLRAQTITPTPVAGQNTIVTIGSFDYMVAYPANMPAGEKIDVVIAMDMGLGEDLATECDDSYGYLYHVRMGWNMRIVRAAGDTIYCAVMGRPHRGFTMSRYGPATDAYINWLVGQGKLDTATATFIDVTVSKGGQVGWYYMTNYQTHNSIYYQKFNKRSFTISTMSTNGNVNTYSHDGRHATFFASDDANTATTPTISYAHHNKIHASSAKRIDSIPTGGHSATTWNTAMKITNYSQAAGPSTHNANTHILDWLIDPTMGLSSNQSPTVDAGTDFSTTLTTTTLTGVANDADGTIASYSWTKISGPTATITFPSSSSSPVTLTIAGTYVFQLTVTDDDGAMATDQVSVTLTANTPPVANAGSDKEITLPTNSTSLSGASSYDPDGTIATYAWTKVSGGTATIASPSSAATNITGLEAGVYTFRLTVTDNGGATSSDNVEVIVNAEEVITPNIITLKGRRLRVTN